MNKTRLYWICQIGGWSLWTFFNLGLKAITAGFDGMELIGSTLVTVFSIYSTHIYRNFVVKRKWLRLKMPKLIPRVLFMIAVLSLLNAFFVVLVYYVIDPLSVEEIGFFAQWLLQFAFFSILFLFWNLVYFLYHYFDNYSTTLKFEATINEIKLNKLKSQLNPHFIFNALNSIRALVDEDPKKSKIAITQLSNILRNSLMMDERRLIKFNEEMQIVKDYLDLESIRFEERLRTEFDIHPASNDFEVPPLMIQTLVENGIKHGISNLVEGGLIKVNTFVENAKLNIQIRNSGQYLNGVVMKHGGYGIENTRQRLKLLFGEETSFSILNENENFVLTDVIIPKIT
ncbi:histidine kinase [Fulvivirgaceae bacterium BMA12]|uniref:Histidine kinase n=1 Tax=Agaribacillus aureus TaxID=3051825 RepID=A0ABT8LH75_9BACT|nr:histidine kinase [Fulvivirgaceae bacterium BMA12]